MRTVQNAELPEIETAAYAVTDYRAPSSNYFRFVNDYPAAVAKNDHTKAGEMLAPSFYRRFWYLT